MDLLQSPFVKGALAGLISSALVDFAAFLWQLGRLCR